MKAEKIDCSGRLLLRASESSIAADSVVNRVECDYEDYSEKFTETAQKDFSRQFFHLYAHRLTVMKEVIMPLIRRKWGEGIPVQRLADLKEEAVERCVIIGTLYKHQELKPSILKEISEEQQLVPQPLRTVFVDDADQLILEDELQRIRLLGQLNVHEVVTGIVCAVLGSEHEGGKFLVEDFCFPSPPAPQRPLRVPSDNRFLILVSGLDLAGTADVLFPLQLLVDWVGGWLGDIGEQEKQAQVARVIIAGNSIHAQSPHRGASLQNVTESLDLPSTLDGVKVLDEFLQQLTSSIPVDLMPGEHDPTNCSLPQQPMHCCMFPKAAMYRTLHGAPNPYEFQIGGRRVLGTAGQPLDDVASFTKLSDRLDILQRTLQWGHLAPSAPDTLRSHPYYEKDPFIISQSPDIYFAGNQPEFQTSLYKDIGGHKVRLVCIPKFSKTFTCAVVNLANLDCYPMSFGMVAQGDDADK